MIKRLLQLLRRDNVLSGRGAFIDRSQAVIVAPPASLNNLATAFRIIVGKEGGLALESGRFDAEVTKLLQPYTIEPIFTIRPGTVFPRSRWLHIRAVDAALAVLEQLAMTLPGPQVCDHLYAYERERLLLEWPDVFEDPICLSSDVGEPELLAFCAALGTHLVAIRH